MPRLLPRALLLALALTFLALPVPAGAATSGSPGDEQLTIELNDSHAGGSYDQIFVKAYAGTTPDGTPVYVYVPEGAIGGAEGVDSLDPAFDHNPGDAFTPCADNAASDYLITQEQIDSLGDTLANQIVAVDEAHFGDMGLADPADPASDALVTLVYNVQDASYYDCAVTTYTAGYFAPDFINSAGMNVIVIDAFDWANRVGDQTGNPDGRSHLYEGVIAHELEHLLMNYSDPGELSWVDEGLADFAGFLNGFDVGGSHLTYHQVFHRETSLTRWGGGLENYGASYTFVQYLWEQAGGNGDGTFTPDLDYDGVAGDLLIKTIFTEAADGMVGVQAAIEEFNAATGANLRSADELFQDWAVAIYLDDEASDRWDIKAADFGDPASTSWTIDIANDAFFDGRGQYIGAMPDARWQHDKKVPGQTALPFGTSYETFRNPGPQFALTVDGDDTTVIAPHTGDTHFYAGYASQSEHILDVTSPVAGGQVLDFWTWYFIEEGWDYGFVEAMVAGEWVTVPLANDAGETVTTNENPHDNNDEGNGLTGTSGGAYFVDEPQYVHLAATLPAGATDVRFRYSTDAAYLDTGWFVDDVQVAGSPAAVAPVEGWFETTGAQDNNWVAQIVAPCDLTPGVDGELTDGAGNHVYRFAGDEISESGFSTECLRTTKQSFTVVISNLPEGDLEVLDAAYRFRLTNTGNGRG